MKKRVKMLGLAGIVALGMSGCASTPRNSIAGLPHYDTGTVTHARFVTIEEMHKMGYVLGSSIGLEVGSALGAGAAGALLGGILGGAADQRGPQRLVVFTVVNSQGNPVEAIQLPEEPELIRIGDQVQLVRQDRGADRVRLAPR